MCQSVKVEVEINAVGCRVTDDKDRMCVYNQRSTSVGCAFPLYLPLLPSKKQQHQTA